MDINKQKFLLIDGDYFLHRFLHQPSKDKKSPTLNHQFEIENFKVSVHNAIFNACENTNGFVDDLIIVFDKNSWRKGITPHRPYYIDELDATPLGYKENRDDKKAKSLINYDNFYKAKEEIIEELRAERLKVLCVDGCEGDDLLMYLASKNTTNPLLIYCSDGDLKYIVSDNVMLYRGIKSKIAPDGEFVISSNLFQEIFGKKDILTIFTQQNSTKTDTLQRLFQTDFQSKQNFINREPNVGVVKTERHIGLFTLCVCGDKNKDNIFPIFRWLNGTGSMWNGVTELMIQKSFVKVFPDETYCDETIKKLFFLAENKNDNLKNLFSKIIVDKKIKYGTETIDIVKHRIMEHYNHNLKINTLEVDNIPERFVEKIKEELKNISSLPPYKTNPKKLKTKTDKFKQNLIQNII